MKIVDRRLLTAGLAKNENNDKARD